MVPRSTAISPNITIFVSSIDLTSIRSKAPLGQYTNTTYLSLDVNSFRDMFGVFNDAQGPLEESEADTNRADLLPPSLSSFELDMDNGRLRLLFNDIIQVSTFSVTSITLQSNQTSDGISQTLTSDSNISTDDDSSVIEIQIAIDLLNSIKSETDLCVNNVTTYLSLSSDALDRAGNNIYDIPSNNAQQTSMFTPDKTPPVLSSFDLNMSVGTITFTFDETVNASSIVPNLVSIVNEDSTISFAFSNITSSSGFSNTVTFTLSASDFNGLKAVNDLATVANNTFLALSTGALTDMNGNLNDPVSQRPVTGFTKDEENPNLVSYSINMNEGFLVLTFDETVNTTSLNISDIILGSGTSLLALTTSYSSDDPVVKLTVNFSLDDLNELKRLEICLTSTTCFLSFTSSLVSDQVDRPVNGQTNVAVAADYTPDTTPPELTEFVLFNLTDGTVSLKFSETIQASSFNITQVTLQSLFAFEVTVVNYTLKLATTLSMDGTTLQFKISRSDLYVIQQMDDLCDRRQHCYIILSSLTIRDMSDIFNEEVDEVFPGFLPSRFIFDTIRPRLDDFDLNMNTGLLTLSFSEPVMAENMDNTAITIVSMANASLSSQYTLTGGTNNGSNGDLVVYIQLTTTDINALKASSFAKSSDDTYMVITSSLVSDVAYDSNSVLPIEIDQPIAVNNYIDDTTPPLLSSFKLDLTEDQLSLTFNEPIQLNSALITSLIIQNDLSSPSSSRLLTGGDILETMNTSLTITVALEMSDIRALKLDDGLATDINDTFLDIAASTFTDTDGNTIRPVTQKATMLISDKIRAELLSFAINMETGQLNLTFNDIVIADTLDASGLTIQNAQTALSSFRVSLSMASITNSSNGYVIIVNIDPLDLLRIKSVNGLATSNETTYLTAQAFTIDDASGNDVLAITNGKAIQVTNFIPDTIPPEIDSFLLDLNSGSLNITFTDTVDHTVLNVSFFSLHDSRSPTLNITIGGQAIRSSNGRRVDIILDSGILNILKNNSAIGSSVTSTYLSVVSNAITDLSGNYLEEISLASALQASFIQSDTTGPEARSFILDLNKAELVVRFSEIVRASSVNSTGFILQSKRDATFFMNERYAIKNGIAVTFDSANVTIRFGEEDLNGIFAITALGNDVSDTYLSVLSSAITDLSGTPAKSIPLTAAIQASQVIEDINRPQLIEYYLDMNKGLLQMSFSEVVLVSSVKFTGFTIQGGENSSFISVTLSSGTTNTVEAKTLNITFSDNDLFALQRLPQLATSSDNTYLSFTNLSLTDAQNYAVFPIHADSALQIDPEKFTADTTGPVLESFDIDFNDEVLQLTFDEVVNGSAVVASGIILRSGPNATNIIYALENSKSESQLSHILQIRLNITELNDIKANTSLATGISNTYIQLLSETLVDAVGNSYSDENNIIQVSTYTVDTRNPILEYFDLDLNSEQLILVFNETVKVSTLLTKSITLQNTNDSSGLQEYTLTSSTLQTGSVDDPEVTISLSRQDLNAIKEFDDLATSNANTYINILSNTIKDMVDINVRSIFPTSAKNVRTYTADNTGPSITAFSIDMDSGMLVLTFNEYVLESTLNISLLALRSSREADAQVHFFTQSSTVSSFDGTSITIQLSTTDRNAIKSLRSLATSSNTTFLQAMLGAVRDAANNMLMEITSDTALQILSEDFTTDTNRPSLSTFDLNMNGYDRILTLRFNETVDASFVVIRNITLLSSTSNYSLTNSAVVGGDSANLQISISDTDFNELTRLRICTAATNCYLSFTSETFIDTDMNSVIAVNRSSVSSYIPDNTDPALVRFISFDLDDGILELEFNETISASSVDFTQLSFDTFSHTLTYRYTLTDGTVLSADGTTLRVQLTTDDLNGLKSTTVPKVCFDRNQCNVRFAAGFVRDITGNTVHNVTTADGDVTVRPATFTDDTTQPQLVSYGLDLDNGRITLTFDEPVNPTEVVVTELTFANRSDGSGLIYDIQNTGTRITSSDSTVFTFDLSSSDLESIKAIIMLAYNRSSTYLNYTSSLARDVAASPNVLNITLLSDSLLQVSNYIPDDTSPTLSSFTSFDLDEGTLRLDFNEPVDKNTFIPSRFAIQSAASSPNESLSLAGGTTEYVDSATKRAIVITLSDDDLLMLKLRANLADQDSHTFISVSVGAIKDTSGNNIAAVSPDSARNVDTFTSDTSSPSLLSFTFDLNTGRLFLTFDDVMNNSPGPVDATEIIFNGVSDGSDSDNQYELTGGTTNSPNGYVTVINLTNSDLNEIKKRTDLATDIDNTYISIRAELIRDVANLPVTPIVNADSKQAFNVTKDTTQPELLQFNLDVNTGRLTFVFSETVNVSTLQETLIVLQDSSDSSLVVESFSLTGGTPDPDGFQSQFDLILTSEDLNKLKESTNLGTDTTNTFLALSEGTVLDMSNNKLVRIPLNAAKMANIHANDTSSPRLTNFTLDLDEGHLILTINESVNSNNVFPNQFTFHSGPGVVDTDQMYSLMGGTVVNNEGTIQTITLTTTDLNALKVRPLLAVSTESTYLSLTSGAVIDFNNQNIVAIGITNAKMADNFIPDNKPPTLRGFEIHIGTGQLILTFDEIVSFGSVNPLNFTLHSSTNASEAVNFTFTGGDISQANSSVIYINITVSDINDIKSELNLATEIENTYISHAYSAVKDMNENGIVAISISEAIKASVVTQDQTAPTLESATLYLSTDILSLTFSETININTLTVTQITLQNHASLPTEFYTLTGGQKPSGNTHEVNIQLTRTDANSIKANTNLATMSTNTFITFPSGFVADSNGNIIDAISNTSARSVTVIPDTASPILESFDFLLDESLNPPAKIVLSFSETVKASTLDITSITLFSSNSSLAATNYTLVDSTKSTNNSAVLTVFISNSDYRALQIRPPLGQLFNTSYLSISSTAVEDIAGNQVEPIDQLQVTDHTVDLIPPSLSTFTVNMELGTITITWTEPVSENITFTGITLLSAEIGGSNYTLTGGTLSQESNTVFVITFSENDLNMIKADPNLATTLSTTYIVIAANSLEDTHFNPNLQQGPTRAFDFDDDRTRPSLQNFTINMDTFVVSLTFSETV